MITHGRFGGCRPRTVTHCLTGYRDVVLDGHRDPGERQLCAVGPVVKRGGLGQRRLPADYHERPQRRMPVDDPVQGFGYSLGGRARPGPHGGRDCGCREIAGPGHRPIVAFGVRELCRSGSGRGTALRGFIIRSGG